MQQYADIYSLPRHSTCFGCHAPIIRSTKNCICSLWCMSWWPRWKEVTVPLPWHTPEVADTVFSTPDDGCMTPETCRVTWQWMNVCILLHRAGPLLTFTWTVYWRSHCIFCLAICVLLVDDVKTTGATDNKITCCKHEICNFFFSFTATWK